VRTLAPKRTRQSVTYGDIFAAMLESDASGDAEATVKSLKRADGPAWLMPHDPAYTPILADSAVIVGKVISVLRRVLRHGRTWTRSGSCVAVGVGSLSGRGCAR
jgi:hypothetical protein